METAFPGVRSPGLFRILHQAAPNSAAERWMTECLAQTSSQTPNVNAMGSALGQGWSNANRSLGSRNSAEADGQESAINGH
jgi:hypothetical protein